VSDEVTSQALVHSKLFWKGNILILYMVHVVYIIPVYAISLLLSIIRQNNVLLKQADPHYSLRFAKQQ